jgi:hypothetical protein
VLAIQNQNLKKKKIKPYKNCKDQGKLKFINSKSIVNADIINNETRNKNNLEKNI